MAKKQKPAVRDFWATGTRYGCPKRSAAKYLAEKIRVY
jgi:hypothetical protein